MTYGKSDDRFSPAASFRYRITKNSRFLARYSEGLSTSQERLFDNLALIGIDRDTGEFIDERSDTRFDPRPDPFDIDDNTEYIKAARADLTFSRGRYSAGLRGYLGREETVSTGDEQDVWRIDAVLSRALGRELTFDLSGGVERMQFAGGRDDDEYRIQPGLRYLLGPRATLFARLSLPVAELQRPDRRVHRESGGRGVARHLVMLVRLSRSRLPAGGGLRPVRA